MTELSEQFNALLDEVRAVEQTLLTADPPLDEPDLLDGYRLAFSLLRVAVDAYVSGDKDNPILVDVIGPYLKCGGDNSDAFYQLAPLDPARTYRVTGDRGDSPGAVLRLSEAHPAGDAVAARRNPVGP